MDQKEAIEKVREYRRLIEKYFDIDRVYLYGSFARLKSHEDSDIDVAIIVDQITGDYFSTTPLLWKLRREVDDRIEPILIDKNNDQAGFIDEILKYGIEITA
jgi:predicted nucleotidyltransferase